MVRGDDNNSITGRDRWRSLAQMLVWISQRTEMPPRDAEQLANAPEMHLKSEGALNELKKEVYKELYRVKILGAARSWPIDKFRILWGDRYVDLLDLFRPLPGAASDIQAAIMREFVEAVRWPDVECNSDWLKRAFPAPAPAGDASTPVANTKAPVAESEPAAHTEQLMPDEPASPVESEPTPPTEPLRPTANTEAPITEHEAASPPPETSSPAPARVTLEPAPAPPAAPPQVQRQPGGRPTDRDMVYEEASWRLKNNRTQAENLTAFAQELHEWLEVHGRHRTKKTGEVMKADRIEYHVRPLWNRHREKTV